MAGAWEGDVVGYEQTVVRPSDRFFECASTPDAGAAGCVCSRCGCQILAGLVFVSVRFNQPQPHLGYAAAGEWRYCRDCVPAVVG